MQREDLRTKATRVTKVHSHAFLKQKSVHILHRHKLRLEQRYAKQFRSARRTPLARGSTRLVRTSRASSSSQHHYQEEPSPLYSSDWITIVSALAQMAKESPEACVIALGLGAPEQNIRPGLLWVVSPNRLPKLVNKKAFESMFWSCRNRKETRYIMGLLALSSTRYPRADHILSYIYDIKKNEMEIFDPNGGLQFARDFDNDMYADFLDAYFQLNLFNTNASGYFKNKLGIRNVYTPTQWCPVGIQQIEEQQVQSQTLIEKQKDFGGYCAAWSIWWLQQRLQNPTAERSQLLVRLTEQFQDQNVNLKKYVQSFAQQLSKTKVQLMRHALALGGRNKYEIDSMMKLYCQAESRCREASNLLYHESKEQGLGFGFTNHYRELELHTYQICNHAHRTTYPIMAEVTANLEPAVRLFSNGRIALVSHYKL